MQAILNIAAGNASKDGSEGWQDAEYDFQWPVHKGRPSRTYVGLFPDCKPWRSGMRQEYEGVDEICVQKALARLLYKDQSHN